MEASLLVSATRHVNAAAYERTEERRDYRNGYYERSIATTFGLIEKIVVPRCRNSTYAQEVFASFSRREREVDKLIKEMFLAGVSTRRVGEVLEPILGFQVSAQTVSSILKSLEEEVMRFHRRSLADAYRYIFFDGVVLKARSVLEVTKRFALCAYGITYEGKRELIDFRQASSESEACWSAFLSNLYARGLKGERVTLIIRDGSPGLAQALDFVYPYVLRQRCWVHKLRNVSSYLPRKYQKACLGEAKIIYLSCTQKEARKKFKEWKARWQTLAPKAVACLEKDLDELLTFLLFPKEHWSKIRTTNCIERAFREVRRRTRPISTFTNRSSCERIIFGIVFYLNKKWEVRPLKQFTHKS